MPADPEERDLHRRLIEGDPVAPLELAERYLLPLKEQFRRRYPDIYRREPTLVEDAVTDAVLNLAASPERYDPERLSLLRYLAMAAGGDVLNAWDKERRRVRREQPATDVELELFCRNEWIEEAMEGTDFPELPRDWREQIASAFPDQQDRQLLALLLKGERRTESYVRILGLVSGEEDTIRAVKRHKDRIKKRLQRIGVKWRG